MLSLSLDRSTALGSAIMAGSAIGLFGWDATNPETLDEVNTAGSTHFLPRKSDKERDAMWVGWQRAVERSRSWEVAVDKL